MSRSSVLYVDFDNLIIGLSETDPVAAVSFASDPAGWLMRLLNRTLDDGVRRWLVRRCYMNPNGFINDPSRVDEHGRPMRIYFSRLRALLTSAGFEVVDCPALTARGKNAADIRIVLDVVDAMSGIVRFDEFVIVSSDSDFTPLMHRLRAADRRIVAVAAETSSSAYLSVVDEVLTTGDLLGLINTPAESDLNPGNQAPNAESEHSTDATHGDLRKRFERYLQAAYDSASVPLNLASLAIEVREAVGDVPPDYFGAGSFTSALRRLELEGATFGPHFLWDPSRHSPPSEPKGDQLVDAPQAVRQVSAVTGLPRLSTADWKALYGVLAAYAASQEWNLTESTKWTRDRLADEGQPVGRVSIGFVVKELSRTNAPLHREPAPTGEEIAVAMFSSIVARAAEAGLPLTDDEGAELAEWMSVPRGDAHGG